MTHSICVYCGSSETVPKPYLTLANDLGALLATKNIRLVYGGGQVGLMGACARAAHEQGGDVLGIIPEFLLNQEKLYEAVLHRIVPDMSTRKQLLYQEADAFIVLPGGIGTLEEVVEVLSWAKLDLHKKPITFLDQDGYWRPLIDFFDHQIETHFVPESFSKLFTYATSADAALTDILRRIGRH